MSLVVHKLVLSPGASASSAGTVQQTTLGSGASGCVTTSSGGGCITGPNAYPSKSVGSSSSSSSSNATTFGNTTIVTASGASFDTQQHQSVITPINQYHHHHQQQQPHQQQKYGNNNTGAATIAVTVSTQSSYRLPYQYTKVVHHPGTTGTASTMVSPQQYQTVLQTTAVVQQQQQQHVTIPVQQQQPTIVTQGRQVALHAYSNQRLLSHNTSEGINTSTSSGEPPPKCYLSSQYMAKTSNMNHNSSGSTLMSCVLPAPTKTLNIPNEGRKAYLPLVLQDHNYMAPMPLSTATTAASPANNLQIRLTNKPASVVVSNVSNTSSPVHSLYSTGGVGVTTHLMTASPSHHSPSHGSSPSPSRTYSLNKNKSTLISSLNNNSGINSNSSVTSNVITNAAHRPVNKLTTPTRPTKSFTCSLQRQTRYATTPGQLLQQQQQQQGTQILHQQQHQHFSSQLKTCSKIPSGASSSGSSNLNANSNISGVVNSVHRSVGVIQGKTVTTSGYVPSIVPHGQSQRYTYRRGMGVSAAYMHPGSSSNGGITNNSSGASVQLHAPIITSIVSPSTQPAPIQTTQPVMVPLTGMQHYHGGKGNRSYVYATGSNTYTATSNSSGVHVASHAVDNKIATNSNIGGVNSNATGLVFNSNNSAVNSVSAAANLGNVNILINNKTSVINRVSTNSGISCISSSASSSSSSSRSSPTSSSGNSSSNIIPTSSLTSVSPPSLTYIPSPHIPPPPGSANTPLLAGNLSTAIGDLGHLSAGGNSGSGILSNSNSRKDSMSSVSAGVFMHKSAGNDQASHSSGSSSDDEKSSSPGPSGEETETAPEGEGDDLEQEDSITRCVCDLSHDDGYMIQCDRCQVWQHVVCMGLSKDNIPDEYLCEACFPRAVDRLKARSIQLRKRTQLSQPPNIMSSSDSEDNARTTILAGVAGGIKNKSAIKSLSNSDRSKLKKKKVKIVDKLRHSSGSKSKNICNTKNTIMNKNKKLTKKAPSAGTTVVHLNNNNNNNLLVSSDEKEKKTPNKARRRKSSTSISISDPVHSSTVTSQHPTSPSSSLIAPLVSSSTPLHPSVQLTYSATVRGWVEGYEAAITNHYSPELRARVHAARINGISPHLRASVQGAVLGHRCKVVDNPDPDCLEYEKKVLVAGCAVSNGTALLEYQGKYLLWSQWCSNNSVTNPACSNRVGPPTKVHGSVGSPTSVVTTPTGAGCVTFSTAERPGERYLPFTLRYTLLQEGLTVAVDARTYGNEARFARRSCAPNAQVRHVVERGSLHLYIVATEDIEEGGEIQLPVHTCNTSEPGHLPPCPARSHQLSCSYTDNCTVVKDVPVTSDEATVLTSDTAAVSPLKQCVSSPMSSPESSSLSPASSIHSSPLSSPNNKGYKMLSKLNLPSTKSPPKGCVSPPGSSGLSSPRLLASPVTSAKELSPHTSPDRNSRRYHTYNKRTLSGSSVSSLVPLQLRNCRRTISESSTLRHSNRATAVAAATNFASTTTDDDEDEDAVVRPDTKGAAKSTATVETVLQNSDESPAATTQQQCSPRKRTPSVDSRSSCGKKSGNESSGGGVDVMSCPSACLRNNSKSSADTPKSPTKTCYRSPSEGDAGSNCDSSKESLGKCKQEQQKDFRKMTREEKKIAAYMKAFEMMEKQAQRKQEMDKKKVEERSKGKKSDDDDDNSSGDETFRPHDKHRKKSKKSTRTSRQTSSVKKGGQRRRSASGPEDGKAMAAAEEEGGASPATAATRFPKTKKSMMNDWLSECVDSDSNTAPNSSSSSPTTTTTTSGCALGVPQQYMRTVPPTRRSSCATMSTTLPPCGGAVASAGGGVSAKKRWLRQAISEEPAATATGSCSPGHTPDSPPGVGDYTTPLKKRRLARESVSGDSYAPTLLAGASHDAQDSEKMDYDSLPDDDMKVKKEDGDLKYEAASVKASVSVGIATSSSESSIKTEPALPDDASKLEPSCISDDSKPVKNEKQEDTELKRGEATRHTRKRKRLMDKQADRRHNIDTERDVSHDSDKWKSDEQLTECDSGGCSDNTEHEAKCKIANKDSKSGDVMSDDEDEFQEHMNTRRDKAKETVEGQRDGKKVYKNKKCNESTSDGFNNRWAVKPVSCKPNKGIDDKEVVDKSEARTSQVFGETERTSRENDEEENVVVDDDDSQESGFEGFGEVVRLNRDCGNEVDVCGDREDVDVGDERHDSEGALTEDNCEVHIDGGGVEGEACNVEPLVQHGDDTGEEMIGDSSAETPMEDDRRGPRTPEGPAPFSPEGKACPHTPANTPPASPPPPSSPRPSSPFPSSVSLLSCPPLSPLPSILKDNPIPGPCITTLGASLSFSSDILHSPGASNESPHLTYGRLSKFDIEDTTALSSSQFEVNRPPLTTLGVLDPPRPSLIPHCTLDTKLPLTTLGSLDENDFPLSARGALSCSENAKKCPDGWIASEQTQGYQNKVPIPVKRKLSILEYRKRKSVNSESETSHSPSRTVVVSPFTAHYSAAGATSQMNAEISNSVVKEEDESSSKNGDALPGLILPSILESCHESPVYSSNSGTLYDASGLGLCRNLMSCSSPPDRLESRSLSPSEPLATLSSSTATYLSQSGVDRTESLHETSRLSLASDTDEDEDDLEEGEVSGSVDEEQLEELSPSGSPPSPPSPGTPPGTPPSPPPPPPPPVLPPSSIAPVSSLSPSSTPSPFYPPPFSPPKLLSDANEVPDEPPDGSEDECSSSYRGTLTDRLKREFGLNVADEESASTSVPIIIEDAAAAATVSSALSLSEVAQPSSLAKQLHYKKKFKQDNPNSFTDQRKQYQYFSLPPRL